ncbi:MAG: hypothetical protein KGL58_07330 [Pseudomonadota bacterium]|nr:hypothetical protein [Pseudomonadota bacterium]
MSEHQDINVSDIIPLKKEPHAVGHSQSVAVLNTDYCLHIDLSPMVDLSEAKRLLKTLQPESIEIQANKIKRSYWIYIPASKVAEALPTIKKKGIDHVRMDSGAYVGAISLGLFDKKEAAKNLFKQVRKQGIDVSRFLEIERSPTASVLIAHFKIRLSHDRWASFLKKFPAAKVKEQVCASS